MYSNLNDKNTISFFQELLSSIVHLNLLFLVLKSTTHLFSTQNYFFVSEHNSKDPDLDLSIREAKHWTIYEERSGHFCGDKN